MKNIFISFFLVVISVSSVFSQLEDIVGKLDVHAGYSLPLGKSYPINGGIAINAEPKFYYNDEIVIGLKAGFNFLQSPATNVKLAPLGTLMLLGEKIMGEGEATFFVGATAGLCFGGQTKKINGKPTDLKSLKQFGYAPRAGVQFGQYRLMGEYHIQKGSASFLTIMLGYSFGGGE